ncbi:acyltransferase family protein [Breoghania sp.]|uniref:acyltransferase family protein n=1 Tax=Breoghania sp. TaxID=2065378 RepID=UPI0029C9E8B7|nr:acyltransferase family protein [Breoghania sp.]
MIRELSAPVSGGAPDPTIPRAGTPAFRADIQGMRAIAALAVLLFHFKLLGAGGGFVGVDVFFVLSGYLITQILSAGRGGYEQGGFPKGYFFRFYAKRLRRIVPAYLVVVLVTLVAGGFILLPHDYARLGSSGFAALGFWSNEFFNAEADYFDTASAFKPLLHTWSLSVEIQFYLLAPLIMAAGLSLPARFRFKAAILAFASIFILSAVLSVGDPSVAFYSVFSRLWQFAAGAGAALVQMRGGLRIRSAGVSRSLDGLAVLALFALPFLLVPSMTWPVPGALLPTVAVAWLLANRIPSRMAVVVLGHPVLQWIGAISYSLYLVHWPLLVLYRHYAFLEPGLFGRAGLFALCFPLAYLLYAYVEVPFRRPSAGRRELRQLAVGAFILCATGAGAWALSHSGGFPQRWPVETQALLAADKPMPARLSHDRDCPAGESACAARPTPPVTVALWGDSHAGALSAALEAAAHRQGLGFRRFVQDGCPPLINVFVKNGLLSQPKAKCLRNGRPVLDAILADPKIHTVVMVARWTIYANGTRFGEESGSDLYLTQARWGWLSFQQNQRVFSQALSETVSALTAAGKRVLLVGQVPEFGFDANRCQLMARAWNRSRAACDIPRAIVEARRAASEAMLASQTQDDPCVSLVDPLPLFCDQTVCHSAGKAHIYYHDDDHLSRSGAIRLVDAFEKRLSQMP